MCRGHRNECYSGFCALFFVCFVQLRALRDHVMVSTANHSASEGNDMKKIAFALIIIASAALQAQSRDHWVGTWATAVVVRPQASVAPLTVPPTASGQPNACQPAAFGPGP